MRSTTGFWLGLVLLASTACEAPGDRAALRADVKSAAATEMAAPQPPDLDAGSAGVLAVQDRQAAGERAAAAPDAGTAVDRMLVYRGQIRVEVSKPDDVMASFRAQVAAWGGHLQRQTNRTVVVRVPSKRFEEAFAWVRSSGRVLSEVRETDDVTEEFIDLGIRLDTARKARERLLEVLKKAEKVEDVLKVEAELRRLTDEIERMEGRRKLLADQVDMSTLEATFQPLTEVPVAKRSRQPSRFAWINRIGAERVMEDF